MYPYQMTISAATPEALRQHVQNWLDSQNTSMEADIVKGEEKTSIQTDKQGSYAHFKLDLPKATVVGTDLFLATVSHESSIDVGIFASATGAVSWAETIGGKKGIWQKKRTSSGVDERFICMGSNDTILCVEVLKVQP